MSKKTTQLNLYLIQTKTAFLVSAFFIITIAKAQTTVVDFENPTEYQHLAWNGTPEVVTNPNPSGINTSANVGKYTIPASSAWSNASVVIINTPLNLKDLSNLEFSVIAPSGSQMYSKLELDGVGGVAEAYATPTADSDWQKVTFNFSHLGGVDVNTATYNKFTFFFNVNDNVGGEVWYFDDIIVNSNSLSTKSEKSSKFKVYPSPVTNQLFVKSGVKGLAGSKAEIYNVTGKLVRVFNGESVNVSNLNTGLYFVSVTGSNGEKVVKKFIKN
ncbi:T9SS type A sorting domain-containing protein [Seonamhaeicola marinus]|uniref:T9SS type A sorting domain-containing protein n=1 Tax=Seonamhaeicola marinus TaxID=1912246 RepID=A0A5D0IRM5_9FLAO|nr:T9SS type A sorting domain-containing protein [Seonamhaeicola marinus]TYA84292.1 T9SS type A sorting domain-containing protein [Seonamhaeicola marinus]